MFADLTDGEALVLKIGAGLISLLGATALAIVMIAYGISVGMVGLIVIVPFWYGGSLILGGLNDYLASNSVAKGGSPYGMR